MKINFPVLNIPSLNYTKRTDGTFLKPIPFDTFERINFKGVDDSSELRTQAGEAAVAVQSTPTEFEIRKIKNMRCPVCGLIMLTDEQIEEFIKDVKDKRGYELVDTFEKYEDDKIFTGVSQNPPKSIFRPQKQEIVNILKSLAKQHPNKALYELVQLEAQKRIDALIKVQLEVVDELEKYVRRCNATKTKKDYFREIIVEFKAEIIGQSENQFSRKKFIRALTDLANDPTTQRRIIEIAEKLPTSEDDINSWFVKYSKVAKSDLIARKFVQQSIPTAEHLQPRSKDGGSSMRNYICDCSDCNAKRGNMEFDIWMTTIPNFKEKLQKYLEDVQEALNKGMLSPEYNSYIEKVIETIKTLSNGTIVLDEPDIINGAKKDKVFERRRKKIEEIQTETTKLASKKREVIKAIQKLESDPYYHVIAASEKLRKQIADITAKKESLTDSAEIEELDKRIQQLTNTMEANDRHIKHDDEWLDDRITKLQSTIQEMMSIAEKMEKLQIQVVKEKEFKERKKAIQKENDFMISQNASISLRPKFNPQDRSEYEKYLYQLELLESAETMMKRLNLSGGRRTKEKDVIQAGIEEIRSAMSDLLRDDRVIYFINEHKIAQNNSLIETIDVVLDEIKGKSGFISDYNKRLYQLGQGNNIVQLQKELESRIKTREIREKIKTLPQLRQEVKKMSETIRSNSDIISKLRKNYKTMKNEEFVRLVNSVK